jgi:peptidoglycan/xylan/chitin deacetylase (PgdA/CDA1 family)
MLFNNILIAINCQSLHAKWTMKFKYKHIAATYVNLLSPSRKYLHRSLMYHSICNDQLEDNDIFKLQETKFKSQMNYLNKYKFKIVPFGTENGISITFDDGYKDNLTIALKILEAFNYPFTIFISTDFIDKIGYLTKSDILELSKSKLVTIGAHGQTHQGMNDLGLEVVKKELIESKKILEKIIDKKVETMSFPHGQFNEEILAIAFDVGYKYIGTSIANSKIKSYSEGHYLINRQCIYSVENLFSFSQKINGKWDWLAK